MGDTALSDAAEGWAEHWPNHWPHAADAGAAGRLAERFSARGASEAALAACPAGQAVLAALGGNSPFLAELALRESATLLMVLQQGAQPVVDAVLAELAATPHTTRRDRLAGLLRQAKRRVALAVAVADIGGAWTLDAVVAALSAFAERCLRLAVDHLLAEAAQRGELYLGDPAHPSAGSGFVVLGMGKLGARELNYSSDIDLVLIYDPTKCWAPGGGDPARADEAGGERAAVYSRLARGLVALMQQRDAEGYVFRTDLRLRPDPAATAPAVCLPAALIYYESLAQNWERAAMLKARPVAGDLAAGQAFLDAIRPFIWRRGLDFAAVADIAGMKRRIDLHRGQARFGSAARGGGPAAGSPDDADGVAAIGGLDLKLGPGGIREIEFLVQTLQLVWGGRDPSLRVNTTLGAMAALVRAGHLAAAAAVELGEAYRVLRGLEHRLQMVADRQTHSLPVGRAALDRFAVFCDLPDAASLAALVLVHGARVRLRYAAVLLDVPQGADDPTLDFTGPDPQPETVAQLAALGFAKPAAIVAAVHRWQAGHARALRSERARALIGQVLPGLLAALARQPQPDVAFTRLDALLARLPAGVQPLSLMQRNPALLERIAGVLGAAPALAAYLARVPQALEGLLVPGGGGEVMAPARLLRERMADAVGLEAAIGTIRRVVHEVEFALSVDTLEARIDADRAGTERAALADAAITALLPFVLADVTRRYGSVPGGGIAVVALGKAGSREMMAGSDLDLMVIYDHPPDSGESVVARGASGRSVAASQYYSRVAQGFIAALTAPGPEGPLYAVDMRLRPSGNAGPVAVSLAGFRQYHREAAWTWERLAIARARVVTGPAILADRVAEALCSVVQAGGDPAVLRRDAATMRARLGRDLPPSGAWDVKHRPGGLMEVEFVAQTLQLVHAAAHPQVPHPTTRVALARLREAGLLADADAETLIGADHLWRTVQGMLRVTIGRGADTVLPAACERALLRAVGRAEIADQAGLKACMDETAGAVRAVFERVIGRPDAALLEKSA